MEIISSKNWSWKGLGEPQLSYNYLSLPFPVVFMIIIDLFGQQSFHDFSLLLSHRIYHLSIHHLSFIYLYRYITTKESEMLSNVIPYFKE